MARLSAALAGIPADRPIILFAGRMEQRKGIHLCRDIVTAVLARHDAAFVFAGEDLFGHVQTELLPAIAGVTRGSVHYLGKLDLAGVRTCMQRADIVLLPSLWENCPYSCIEAMAAKRAIVCSNQGGMPELIQDDINGLLAATGAAASFARQIGRLLDDATLRKRLGDAARATVEREPAAEHVARLAVDFYGDCIRRF